MLLTHLGFDYNFIKWIFSCITTSSFTVLINDSASPFFGAERGLSQGCPLSHLLFLLVAEGLSRALSHEKWHGAFKGMVISHKLRLSHLLFIDDILIFCDDSRRDEKTLEKTMNILKKETCMVVNDQKSILTTTFLTDEEEHCYATIFPFQF